MDLEAFPQVNPRKTEGSRRERDPCMVDRSGSQCFIDPPVSGLLAAVDALRVHPQQHLHTVTCTVSHLRGRDPAVRPERDGTVTQVVGPAPPAERQPAPVSGPASGQLPRYGWCRRSGPPPPRTPARPGPASPRSATPEPAPPRRKRPADAQGNQPDHPGQQPEQLHQQDDPGRGLVDGRRPRRETRTGPGCTAGPPARRLPPCAYAGHLFRAHGREPRGGRRYQLQPPRLHHLLHHAARPADSSGSAADAGFVAASLSSSAAYRFTASAGTGRPNRTSSSVTSPWPGLVMVISAGPSLMVRIGAWSS